MAITKIKAIHKRLDSVISYANNGKKNSEHIFANGLNCNLDTAYHEMLEIKKHYGDTGKILGYHLIQSFKPNETTPETAHKIGIELASRIFKDYQVIVSTHIDKHHIHNHIVFSSTNFKTGAKYKNNKKDYFYDIRKTSDELCREYNLSIIESKSKGKHYAEWKAEKENKPTIRSLVKNDIELAIKRSNGFWCFFEENLERMGYKIKNGKYLSVKAPFAERYVRLDRLGYSKENISDRLYNWSISHNFSKKIDKRYRYKGSLLHIRPYKTAWHIFNELLEESQKVWIKDGKKWRHKTDEEIVIEGAIGLSVVSLFLIFSLFVMLLKLVSRCATPPSITGFLKNNVIKLDKYRKQLELIKLGKITPKINKTVIDILSKLDRIRELRREKLRAVGEQITKKKEADYER